MTSERLPNRREQESFDFAHDGVEFTASLGRNVNRPTPLIVPGFALRTLLGEFAEEGMLGGQRAIPAALERAGFVFHHNTIGEALTFATAPKDT